MIIERIKEDEVRQELVKIGMNDRLASDLAFRYYNNEITLKDLEFLKLELNSKIDKVRTELKTDIEFLKKDIKMEFKELRSELKFSNRLLGSLILIVVPLAMFLINKFF